MLRLYVYPLIIIIYIIATLAPHTILFQLIGVLANFAIIISIFHARGLYFFSGIIFYIVGMIIFFTNDLSWEEFFLQFDSMLGILALFIMLPFLNSLILVGRYDKHLSSLLEYKVKHVGDLYQRGGIVSHILGLFLNIATIPLVLHSLHTSLKQYPASLTDRFYAQSLLRAYAFCLMWSPMEIMIIQSLDIANREYIAIFPFLVLFAGIMHYLDTTFGKRKFSEYPIKMTGSFVSLKSILKKIRELFILLLLLVIIVTILNSFLEEGYLFSLVLLIIPASLLWSIRIGKLKSYVAYTIPHFKTRTKELANFFFMFLSAGFFVEMLGETQLLQILQEIFTNVSGQMLLLFIYIGLYFSITSFIGFHPLVSIILLAEIIAPILPEVAGPAI